MLTRNMVRLDLLGDLLHGEGGYLHDLRSIKFATRAKASGGGPWPAPPNGNLYPTHGLGPIAQCMDINRGDRFEYLVSMSGPSRGLQDCLPRPLSSRCPAAERRGSCWAT